MRSEYRLGHVCVDITGYIHCVVSDNSDVTDMDMCADPPYSRHLWDSLGQGPKCPDWRGAFVFRGTVHTYIHSLYTSL